MKWLRQLFCRHVFYLKDMKRLGADLVRCPCGLCGKVFEREYGLLLPGKLENGQPPH